MTGFKIEYKQNKIAHIWDRRYENNIDITNGNGLFGTFCYTLITDDITKGANPEFTPYVDRVGEYEKKSGNILSSEAMQSELEISDFEDGLHLHLTCNSDLVSEFGINLPFCFMSSKSGQWESQILLSSPYYTKNKKHNFVYLTRPDGNNLLVLVESLADGYKIDYSDFLSGHYLFNFKYLCKFDKAYHERGNHSNELNLYILPVKSYGEALEIATKIYNIPALSYILSSGFIDTTIKIKLIGICDRIEIISPIGYKTVENLNDDQYKLQLKEYGIYKITPYFKGREGLGCSVFCIDNWERMYRSVCHSIPQTYDILLGENEKDETVWKPPHLTYRGVEDFNLCEQEMWALSSFRYLRFFQNDEKIKNDVKNLINVITAKNKKLQIDLCTILDSQEGAFPFNTKNSTRIQEVFAGVSILLEAFHVFDDSNYLEKAITIMESIIQTNISKGRVNRYEFGNFEDPVDYTTVTVMVFPVVDLARQLKKRGDTRFAVFEKTAIEIADFIVNRGLDFPTEGGFHESVGREMEEGSISCSALSVMYVAKHIKYKEDYISFVDEILKIHDAWSMYTYFAPMFRSSLRWWETIWEGDSDGPAICCGHAWTIWRAEAEFIYGLFAKDTDRIIDSYNAFMSNFSKTDKNGNMYAIYQCEPISGGGPSQKAEDMVFCDKSGFPDRPDISLSRYVYARAFETWFCCTAVIDKNGERLILNGIEEENSIRSLALTFEVLYIDIVESLIIDSDKSFDIVSPNEYTKEIKNGKTYIAKK